MMPQQETYYGICCLKLVFLMFRPRPSAIMCLRPLLVCCLGLVAAAVTTVCAQRLDLDEGDACRRVAGVEWTCKKLKDCVKAQEGLNKGRRPETCNFIGNGNEVVVCCEPTQTNIRPTQTYPKPTQTYPRPTQTKPRPTQTKPRPTQTKPKPNPAQLSPTPTPISQRPPQGREGKSKQMCKKYAESVYYKVKDLDGNVIDSVDTCALIEPLITNGTNAQPREYPHMALIGYGNKNNIQWRCGGSLISERWVLSAAHCTLTGENRPKWVRLGDYNYRSTKDDIENNARSVEFDIIQQIIHPQYNSSTKYNDIALYKLNRDVEFNEYVRPICLHTEYVITKKDGIITGWGRTDYGGRTSDILQKGNVTFIPKKQCSDSLKNVQNLIIQDNIMLCAANFLSETDSCQGDSGGPLQYRLTDPYYCMYSQVGVTSFGVKCATKYPAVYTRVSYFVPWIEKIVWP